ncbi:hypothetical protein LEN26_015125 [Aphanomyces euteiches]|nr:hypothetical protein LEN26_015125 [Aphanomyces euteiches]KAH9106678.1 hypothetical protein AeMF1_017818 [Aphanomyces euteiches]KAH9187503.1 hypothetical protein AeNC1_010524 [Aphanomyces euteiches]
MSSNSQPPPLPPPPPPPPPRSVRFAYSDEVIPLPPSSNSEEQRSERPHLPATLPRESGNGLLGLKLRSFGSLMIAQNYERMQGTGSAVWQAAEALLQMMKLPAYMSMLHGRKVLELGAGTGINSLAAAMLNSNVVATDGDPDALALIQENIKANQFQLPKPVSVRPLVWGNQEQIQALKTEFGLFDVILGSDILFEAIEGQLLVTIYELCAMQGVVILTHTPREPSRENMLLKSFSTYFTMNESIVSGTNVVCTILTRKVRYY